MWKIVKMWKRLILATFHRPIGAAADGHGSPHGVLAASKTNIVKLLRQFF